MKTGRVKSVIKGCGCVAREIGERYLAEQCCIGVYFDGPEQTEQTVEQTRLDPVLARPQTLRSRSRHRQSELSTELARICASVYELPASSDCSDREERTLEHRRSALALYTHLLEQ